MSDLHIDFSDPKYQDPVVEVYAIRRAVSAKYGHDVYRLAEAIAAQQREAEAKGRKYVRLPIAHVSSTFEYPVSAPPVVPCACETTNNSPGVK